MNFKSYLNESNMLSGKNPVGTIVVLGGSKNSEKFASAIKEYEKAKEYDEFIVANETPDAISVELGRSKNNFFIQSKNSKKVYHISGSASVLNNIFKYKTGRGKGGVEFEDLFSKDLATFISSGPDDYSDLQFPDLMKKFYKVVGNQYGIDLKNLGINEWKIIDEGKKNKRRYAKLESNGVTMKSDGATLTDVTLEVLGKKIYISLKMSNSMYLANISLKEYVEGDEETRANTYSYFGLDGEQMGGFGEEYKADMSLVKSISASDVKKNYEQLMNAAFGSGYIMVHNFDKTGKDSIVDYIDNETPKITSKIEYNYPGNKRAYANAQFYTKIHGYTFKVNAQFRDTKGGVSKPTYLRLNLVRA